DGSTSYGDVWGDGDFAYVGRFGDASVHIVDISDPANPVAIEYVLPPSHASASAQDVKVANGLLFIALESTTNAGVHIVDVRDPMNPVGLVDVSILGYNSIHNTFYSDGFLYLADSNTARVGIVDLRGLDPDNPPASPITTAKWILQNVGTSMVHDVTVAGNRLYVAAWDSGLWMYNVANVATQMPTLLAMTPDGGDNTHSCWPTANGDYVVTGEERNGGGIKVYRVLANRVPIALQLTDSLTLPAGQAFSVHNQVIDGYRLYNSWYEAGLQVFDIDPATGQLAFFASYDTFGGAPVGFGGAWGVYPLLGPDRVLVSDRSTGLYVLRVGVLAGDVNGDCVVNVLDLIDLLLCFGQPALPGCEPEDVNGDGDINVLDLIDLLLNFGQTCP
ncbi:MAG: hypothetical protein V3T72_10175, partial [Thermoanaerobaculia bacterium]